MKMTAALSVICLLFLNCRNETKTMIADNNSVRYVALGDSYTICEGATTGEAWPRIMADNISANGTKVELIANPSRTGWTTQNLIDHELSVFDASNATAATLLIGVNDWVQGVDKATFTKNLKYILDHLQEKLADNKKILLITIPDFGVTPTGAMYSGGRNISQGISEFNDVIKAEATTRGLPIVDIFGISKDMGKDPTLIADDGLHPSAKEYLIWEKMIEPVFQLMING